MLQRPPEDAPITTPDALRRLSPASGHAWLTNALLNPTSTAYRHTMRLSTTLVMLSIALIAAEGVESLRTSYRALLDALDYLVLAAFTLEYVANVAVARPVRRYVFGLWGVIDLLAVLPFYLAFLHIPGLLILRELRLVRVVRVLKLIKAASASREESDEVWLPLAIFVSLAGIAWIVDDFLTHLGVANLGQLRAVVLYTSQVAVVLSGAYFVNRLTQVLLWDGLIRNRFGEAVPRLIRDVFAMAVYSGAVLIVIANVFNRPLTGILTATGAMSVVIGLALRNVILDLFMGLAMQVDRPFKIGDYVMLQSSGLVGRVTEIHWRTTRLHTNENNAAVIPNNRIGDMVVINFSDPDPRAEFELVFTLDHEVPHERALRALTSALRHVVATGGILADPEPKARIKGTSVMGTEYKVKYWIDCSRLGPGKARHLVLTSVFDQLASDGLALARSRQELVVTPPEPSPSPVAPSTPAARAGDGAALLDTAGPHAAVEADLEDRVGLLRCVEAFAALDESDLARLARDAGERRFAAGQPIATQG